MSGDAYVTSKKTNKKTTNQKPPTDGVCIICN